LARLVELALVVPVEVTSRLIEAVPAVVDKVPTAAERVRREVVLARFLGKMVVDQGVRELRSRLYPDEFPDARTDGGVGVPAAAAEATEQVERAEPSERSSTATVVSEAPEAATLALALADYDHLSSAQIVAKLEGLDSAERSAIERHELAGRHRRTILGKLELLRQQGEAS
jgi:hypothetical protein